MICFDTFLAWSYPVLRNLLCNQVYGFDGKYDSTTRPYSQIGFVPFQLV